MRDSDLNEKDTQSLDKISQRGIYLLPNLMTTAALFAGFYAIVAAMRGLFDTAAIAIFIAMIADGLDGRIARLTNTQSAFGAQYDSLSDMVAFGLTPALVVYSWSLFSLGKLGWFASFVFAAATALRLARFNTQVMDKRYFQGLPCPAAAGLLASTIWMVSSYNVYGMDIAIPLAILTITIAILQVSSIRYWSFKSVDFLGKVPFITIVLSVFIVGAIAIEPQEMLFAIFAVYAISGPIITLWQIQKMRKLRRKESRANKIKKGKH